jgi:hypothetical protein
MEVPTIFLLAPKSEIKKLKTQKWSDFGSFQSPEVRKKYLQNCQIFIFDF